MKPVPIGISGELYIGGASLANGYLNRPSLTAEKFLPNPFSSEPGARLYRTGDLGRFRPDGAIEFLGRIDHQVKIRGFRVEPGEIEATLSQHPMVREAAVLAQGNNSHDKRLVAYLVADKTNTDFHNDLHGELRQFLGEQLPEYMIPSVFMLLDALPLTPNGKLNRNALPEPGENGNGAEPSYVAPQTENERSLAAIWQEVFGMEQISVNSNFFELGGHSLMMVRVHSKLREVMHKEIPMIDLFRYPTISALAKSFGEEQRAEPSSQRIHERAEKQRAAANRQKQMMNWRTKANG
jgi:acyl carrier protein